MIDSQSDLETRFAIGHVIMEITQEILIQDLKRAGIKLGDILVVHSSLKSIGHVVGGVMTVINSLRQSIGMQGAVLFPCLTFDGSVTQYLHTVDTVDLGTCSIKTGAIPAAAWQTPNAYRSIHPTHAVAGFGEKAGILLRQEQSGQGPCGTDSPFYRAAMAGGKILMIGVSLDTCTLLHCVEEIAASYIFSGEIFDVLTIDFDGNPHNITVKGYCTNVPRNFAAIENALIEENIMQIKKLGLAELRIINARAMIEKVVEWVKQDDNLLLKNHCPMQKVLDR
jgi:aminoglycoside 3-N-acetyltransferase